MQRLSARPHNVGTPYDKDNAEWILARFKSYGLDAHIEQFDVLYPTPKERLVEMVAPTQFKLALKESPLSVDPTSQQTAEQLPTYHAYSIDGDVTAPLVYVNYGVPADYAELARHGISVKGAIVIARYGGSWRGIKPKVAAEHGAVGCLIYSDPRDDGFADGDVFPKGPMRPKDGVQRGSVMDMPVYPGDPLTPGIGATPGAKRLALSEVKTLTKIPVLPISYGDAEPLLAALRGPVVPAAWRGALAITYRFGAPGPTKVHLVVKSDWNTKPLYDVVARIPGSVAPDEWIVRGNHHDAWVNGAEDPISGQIALLEEARAYGQLLAKGWRPRRTIIYCAWDGEEPGLLGSTEWAEQHAEELEQHAVAYINTDGNGRGYLGIEGSHILEAFFNDVAKDIMDPESHVSVWKRWQAERLRTSPAGDRDEVHTRPNLRIGALGSGSDYSAFVQHLGVASANLGYGGEDRSGIYHSIYDDFYWYTHFDDTNFVYARALAQTIGTAVMRLSDAQLIPFDYTGLAETVGKYRTELEKLAKDEADSLNEMNREIRDGVYAAVSDPHSPTVAPDSVPTPKHVDFAPLEDGVDALTRAAQLYAAAAVDTSGSALDRASTEQLASVNAILIKSERALTSPEGLPNRPWYRHLLYAPGFYTGYGVKTVPGVREAIEQNDWGLANSEIVKVGKVLNDEAAVVTQAAAALRGMK
ncbi:MAG TPA: transferrin receptor-like dimerization domain-containing protein [Gemmatimonadaceae bacterium]|nr:transferrin receptor-like dimerization domain-containing protein [Gemmatimonadaceae bacterium]